jgi:leucyl aminopeptidase
MQIEVKQAKVSSATDEAVLLGYFEETNKLSGNLKEFDRILEGSLTHLLQTGDFTGKLGQTAVLYPQGKLNFKRVVFVGLGKRNRLTSDKLRRAYGFAGRKMSELKIKSLTVPSFDTGIAGISLQASSQAMTEGILLSQYKMDRYKTNKDDKVTVLDKLTFIKENRKGMGEVKKGVENGELFSWANNLARDLGNTPGNELTPTKLAAEASKLAQQYKLKCTILSQPEIKKLKMNTFLAVAAGSQEPPKLIILENTPPKKTVNTIVLVGKGITFDSGGLSLKPTDLMLEMKGDMMGGAVVMASVVAFARLRLPLRVIGIIPATENLPSGSALKVGDIITSHSGKTIEVLNTDAEGRLILADALSYAQTFKPDAIVDVATLTGIIKFALGTFCAGLFGNNQKMITRMIQAGEAAGERVWSMPMWEEYEEYIKGDLADIKNTGGRPAGSILAAKFLQNFVGDLPWVHLDIAGVDFKDKEEDYRCKGASGFGARLLLEFLRDWKKI